MNEQKIVSGTDRRLHQHSLLGELLMGVLASMAIGTGFSIVAGAFVLVLAGGRVEATPAGPATSAAWMHEAPVASVER